MPVTTSAFKDENISLSMYHTITNGINFDVPDVDFDALNLDIPNSLLALLGKAPEMAVVDDITEPKIKGNKTFDRMMHAFKIHLQEELQKGNITGANYATTYTQLAATAMQCAVQFELERHKSQYENLLQLIQAITARAQMYISIANAKVQLAIAKSQANVNKANFANTVAQLGIADANYGFVHQQRESFARRDERDTAKLFSDAWVAQKGMDEGLTAPTALQNEAVNSILTKVRANVNLN